MIKHNFNFTVTLNLVSCSENDSSVLYFFFFLVVCSITKLDLELTACDAL